MKITSTSRRLLKALKSKKVRLIVDFAIITLIGLAIFRNFLFSGYWPAGGDVLGWISREYLFGTISDGLILGGLTRSDFQKTYT